MLDMGFADDIESILDELRRRAPDGAVLGHHAAADHRHRQALPARPGADHDRPRRGERRAGAGDARSAYVVQRAHKPAALGRILDIEAPTAALVFCRTRLEVDQLTETMNGRGYRAEALHGGMDQGQRDRVMGRLRDGTAELLIATDVAARGLDVDVLTHVVNYDVPSATGELRAPHRAGRAGRPRGRGDHAGRAARAAPARQHRAADEAADRDRAGAERRRPAGASSSPRRSRPFGRRWAPTTSTTTRRCSTR